MAERTCLSLFRRMKPRSERRHAASKPMEHPQGGHWRSITTIQIKITIFDKLRSIRLNKVLRISNIEPRYIVTPGRPWWISNLEPPAIRRERNGPTLSVTNR